MIIDNSIKSDLKNTGESLNFKTFPEITTYQPTKEDYAYIAGLLEAEGSFLIAKQKRRNDYRYSPCISVAMREKDGIDFITKIFPTNIRICKNKQMYSIRYMAIKTKEIIPLIYPYLIFKNKQADILLEVAKLKSENGINTQINHILKEKHKNLTEIRENLTIPKQYNCSELNEIEDLSYIAGLIDGEGSFGIYNTLKENKEYKQIATFQIWMNDWQGLAKIQTYFGGDIKKYKKAYFLGYKDNTVNGKLYNLLKKLIPLLKLKKKQAEICLNFIENKNVLSFNEIQALITECKLEKNSKQIGDKIIRPINILRLN